MRGSELLVLPHCTELWQHSVVWRNEEFTLTEKIFRQINSFFSNNVDLKKFLPKKCASNFLKFPVTNFVKATSLLLKKLLNGQFHEIYFGMREFTFHSMVIAEILSHTFFAKIS